MNFGVQENVHEHDPFLRYVDREVPGAVASAFRRDLKGETAEVNEKIQPNGPRKMLALAGLQ
jgi:hypothetical protein